MKKDDLIKMALDTMGKISNQRIVQGNKVFLQVGATCYAHAASSIIISTQSRIIGRIPDDHYQLADRLIKQYGTKGANTLKVLQNECLKRHLRCEKIDQSKAYKIVSEGSRPIVATFALSNDGWDNFSQQIKKDKMISKPIPTGNQGHAVVIGGVDKTGWWIKNSWDTTWADKGFAKVLFGTIQFQFIDVYFCVQDLTKEDLQRYQRFKKGQNIYDFSEKDLQMMITLGSQALKSGLYSIPKK